MQFFLPLKQTFIPGTVTTPLVRCMVFSFCFENKNIINLLGVVCGNTYIMKPSERDPSACMALVELFKEAGVPDGVVNVIHGQHDTVNFICDHPDIKLVSVA
jgi:hypothetical protein